MPPLGSLPPSSISAPNEALGWWTGDLRETAEIIRHLLDSYSRHMEEGEGDYH